MVDVYFDGKGPASGAWIRVRFRCSVMCTGKIGLHLNVGSGSDVSVREI